MVASETLQETLSFEQVRGLLAHRFPFLMIDRVTAIERGKRLLALKHITGNELCFVGHFPGHAIFPGVLILEAMAQSVSLLDLLSRDAGMPPAKYLGSANAKFLTPVVPGDSLEIEVRLAARFGAIVRFEGVVRCGGERIASGAVLVREGIPEERG